MNVELDSIVRSYLFSQGYNTTHKYIFVMKILIEFLAKFSRNHTIMSAQDIFYVDEKKAIQLPPSFVALSAIAWRSGDRLIKFERDSTINTSQSYCDDAAAATPNASYNIFEAWPYNAPILNQVESSNFTSLGVGHNGSGYFNFNWPAREIQFSTDSKVSGGVYMRYRTNGFNPKSRSVIPEIAEPTAVAYIHHQMARMDRRLGDAAAETRARERIYAKEYDDLLADLDPIDYNSLIGVQARAFDSQKIIR